MNEMPTSTPKSSRNTTLVLVVVALVAIAFVAVGYYLSYNNTGKPQEKETGQTTKTGEQKGEAPSKAAVPAEFFSYVGEVKAVGDNELTVVAKPTANYVDKETTLTVKIDDNTQIIRRTIPKVLPKEGGADLFKQATIKLSDISKGENVTVVSATNVKDKTEFTASRVEVLEVK